MVCLLLYHDHCDWQYISILSDSYTVLRPDFFAVIHKRTALEQDNPALTYLA